MIRVRSYRRASVPVGDVPFVANSVGLGVAAAAVSAFKA